MIKASIIITAYNSAAYIERSLKSALKQDFPHNEYEVFVIDDGSTDETPEILKKHSDAIRVLRQQNQGFVSATNTGFRNAQGRYVTKLDSDDEFGPDLLKEEVAILEAHPEIDFVYSDYCERFGDQVRIVTTENVFHTVAIGTMYRHEKLAAEGYWRTDARLPEYDLILETWGRWQGYRIVRPLFTYIRREGSVSKQRGWQELAMADLKARYPERVKEIETMRNYY